MTPLMQVALAGALFFAGCLVVYAWAYKVFNRKEPALSFKETLTKQRRSIEDET